MVDDQGTALSDVGLLRRARVVRELFTDGEWGIFESRLLTWLGASPEPAPVGGHELQLDGALLIPSAYTQALAVRGWMVRLQLPELAARIIPEDYADTDLFQGGTP